MIIDSHAHLTDPKLKPNVEDILQKAGVNDVQKIISIGTSISDCVEVLELANTYQQVYAGIGVYPDEMPNVAIPQIQKDLDKLLSHPKIVGIGETGIDINTSQLEQPSLDLNRQKELFGLHIALSQKYKLPLIIHNRNADEYTLDILKSNHFSGMTGVFHCYTASWEFAKKILDLGFYISFTGIITFPNALSILETVKNIPNDLFLVETDAPYLAPIPHRGKINTPEYVKITLQKIAEVKQISLVDAQEYAYKNTTKLFSKLLN